MSLVIEKGIPIPRAAERFDWSKMEVNDSMDVTDHYTSYDTARASLHGVGKRRGITLSTRLVNGRVRVWRTA